jgi:hypothetical protein
LLSGMGERPERPNQRTLGEGLADTLLGSHAALAESIRQMTDQWTRSFKPIAFQLPSWLEAFNRQQAEVARQHTELTKRLHDALTPAANWATKMAPTFALMGQIELLNKAHWIAHPALPIGDLVGGQSDPEILGDVVAEYFE